MVILNKYTNNGLEMVKISCDDTKKFLSVIPKKISSALPNA